MSQARVKNEYQIALHFEGTFVHGKTVTARTLAHSLASLQRMIDKTVLYEYRGSLKKYDSLPANLYHLADFDVLPFQDGCVKIPLSGICAKSVISKIKGLLHEPFETAQSDEPIEHSRLVETLPSAYNRAAYEIDVVSHEDLIADSAERAKRYFSEALYKDFDQLISPLRSSLITDADLISLELVDEIGSREYEFNKSTSQRFHEVVSAKQLGPTVKYSGRLVVFGESKSVDFPFFGKFFSYASKQEHKLYIANEEAADRLRELNASAKDINFFGSPITAWGTFDERRGDIVFLKII